MQKADDFGSIEGRYFLGAFGRGQADPTSIKAVTDSSGNVSIEYSGRVRSFTLEADGSYLGIPGDAATLMLTLGMIWPGGSSPPGSVGGPVWVAGRFPGASRLSRSCSKSR